MTDWLVEHHRGPAGELHARATPDDGRRRIWVLSATRPAVVLGSTQRESVVDRDACDAAGVDVVRRRSGGGAVWVAPGDPVWVDIVVPRDDPLFVDDVGHSFVPIGRAWQRALAGVGVGPTTVHQGAVVHTTWSRLVCFAGVGPGEVLQGTAKLVGLSQRRTRAGSRFQCALLRRWDPAPLAGLLSERPPLSELVAAGTGIGEGPDRDVLVEALVGALTTDDLG